MRHVFLFVSILYGKYRILHYKEEGVGIMLYLRSIVALAALSMVLEVTASTVWTGAEITFTKFAFSDYTLAENQDFLTSNVSLTRGYSGFLCNVSASDVCAGTHDYSYPSDMEWAWGSIEDWDTLTYSDPLHTVELAIGQLNMLALPGKTFVAHILSDDIFFELTFNSWSSGNSGGGFSYDRTTPNTVPVPAALWLYGTALVVLAAVKRRKTG